MEQLERTPLFTALARPQMFAGGTYNYFVINAVIAAELFLIFRSVWELARRDPQPRYRSPCS